jgi:hypothetical protein
MVELERMSNFEDRSAHEKLTEIYAGRTSRFPARCILPYHDFETLLDKALSGTTGEVLSAVSRVRQVHDHSASQKSPSYPFTPEYLHLVLTK